MTKKEIVEAFEALLDVVRRRLEGCSNKDCLVCAENQRVIGAASSALDELRKEVA